MKSAATIMLRELGIKQVLTYDKKRVFSASRINASTSFPSHASFETKLEQSAGLTFPLSPP
jgi:hypothetical protein